MFTEAGFRESEHRGRHCVHELGSWFTDPRGPPPRRPPPRSRRVVFEEILYSSDLSYNQKKLLASAFIDPNDDGPSEKRIETFPVKVDPTLPEEFKKLIWHRAWLPRTIDIRASNPAMQGIWSDQDAPVRPRSFSERMTDEKMVQWYESELFLRLSGLKEFRYLNTCFGFITSQDIIFFGRDYWKGIPQLSAASMQSSEAMAEQQLISSITSIPRALNSQAIAVHWDRFMTADVAWDNRDDARTAWNVDFLDRWSFIKDIKSLKTLYITWIGSHPHCDHGRESRAITYRVGPEATADTKASPIPVLVDLYDSAREAEMMSLDTSEHPKTPHWQHWPASAGRPRMCINCERAAWFADYKHNIEKLWILLNIQYFDRELERRDVLKPNTPLDKENDWVKWTLQKMPEIKPAILFDMYPRLESQSDVYCEWEEDKACEVNKAKSLFIE
jgi:hypothetical protein